MKNNKIKSFFLKLYWANERFIKAMAAIIVIGTIGIILKRTVFNTDKQEHNEFPLGMKVESFDDYMETQKSVSSDIEGYSVYDKYSMGLQRQEGSDSDFDGLTDKEEIEKYGTDPLKASTAGDLYTDSYKVKHGMDPFTYAEYTGEMEFPYVECPEIGLTASSPTDFNAVITDCTDSNGDLSSYGVRDILKGYELYNYSGKISIDTSDINEKYDIFIGLGPFLVEDYTKFEKYKYELNEGIAVPDYTFDNHDTYFIYITKQHPFPFVNGIFDFGKSIIAPEEEVVDGDDEAEALTYGISLIDFFTKSTRIEYTECDSVENTDSFIADSKIFSEKVAGKAKNVKMTSVSKEAMKIKKGFFNKFLSPFKFVPGKENSPLCAFVFYYAEYKRGYPADSKAYNPYYKRINTGFDKYVDELPFQNFQSYIGKEGNCAGISHLTSYLYNTKSLPSSGSYNCNINDSDELIEWNIGEDETNNTLTDPGLIDYKSSEFIDSHSEAGDNFIGSTLSDGEKQFVNMVGCFWTEGNDRININDYELVSEEYNNITVLDNVLKQLDQGKVLDVYMYMRYGGAHAVNVYGYEWFNKNALRLLVYDSNLPQDNREGFEVDDVTNYCMIEVIIKKNLDGQNAFDYIYWPMTSNVNYMATSKAGIMQTHALVFMDENWNVLN